MKLLHISSRSAVVLIEAPGLYETEKPYLYTLLEIADGKKRWPRMPMTPRKETSSRKVLSFYALFPDTRYSLRADFGDGEVEEISFCTADEKCTMDVRRFGALGDGVHNDGPAIQAAIACCPEGGRVFLPGGTYLTGPIFLKSGLHLDFASGAVLKLVSDRSQIPVLPGMTPHWDEKGDTDLGSWEGNPLDSFASLITGVEVKDVTITGPGVLDGGEGDWWKNPKVRRGAWRPRLFFLCRSENVAVHGLTFRNSPAWNIQPYFSRDLKFLDISVNAPADSPNTDGFDPESCENLLLCGAHFSVGDDCIAIKAGKIYMATTRHTPTRHVRICHCLMEDGHGGVTVGSEMAGGVYDVEVSHCLMRHTDRGLRIKTRRGRGKEGVIDGIVFRDIRMENVRSPLCCNAMYYCDPDGHTPYVQTREKLPVDDRTPRIGSLTFERVAAVNAEACAGYFLGIPEMPCEKVTLKDCSFDFAPDGKKMVPVMAEGVEECFRRGLILRNVREAVIENTRFNGIEGPDVETEEVGSLKRDGE